MLEVRDKETGALLLRVRGGSLAGADLHGVDLQRAFLDGVNLKGVNLLDADLRQVSLRGANFGFFDGHARWSKIELADPKCIATGSGNCPADINPDPFFSKWRYREEDPITKN